MSNFVKLAAEASDKYIAALDQNQQGLLSYFVATRHWVMDAPTVPAPAFAAVSPQEIVASGFAFASSMLAQQKAFADKLASITARTSKVAPAKAAPAPAAKPAAVAKPPVAAATKAAGTRTASAKSAGAEAASTRVTSIASRAKRAATAGSAPTKPASKKPRRSKTTPSSKK
jgi:hypothetical protein